MITNDLMLLLLVVSASRCNRMIPLKHLIYFRIKLISIYQWYGCRVVVVVAYNLPELYINDNHKFKSTPMIIQTLGTNVGGLKLVSYSFVLLLLHFLQHAWYILHILLLFSFFFFVISWYILYWYYFHQNIYIQQVLLLFISWKNNYYFFVRWNKTTLIDSKWLIFFFSFYL